MPTTPSISLTLRQIKLSKLTHQELDDNFTNLKNGILDVYNDLSTIDAVTLGTKSLSTIESDRATAIQQAVTNLVNSAPSSLNTLGEIAAAINNDPSFSSTIGSQLSAKLDTSSTTGWQQYAITQSDGYAMDGQSISSDFDNILAPGVYHLSSIISFNNTPSGLQSNEDRGILVVWSNPPADLIKQELTSNLNNLYIRVFDSGTWSSWRQI